MNEYQRYVTFCKRNGYTEIATKQEFAELMEG